MMSRFMATLLPTWTRGFLSVMIMDIRSDTSCNTTNVLVYNNTLVDNDINIRIVRDDAGWTGNEIKNNISWTITAGTVHANNYSPTGVTWSHNLFDDAVSGKAANKAVIGDPDLEKSSGWRSVSAVALTVLNLASYRVAMQ